MVKNKKKKKEETQTQTTKQTSTRKTEDKLKQTPPLKTGSELRSPRR